MKKKNLILDFTSLLDVIMIILFVVIANMSEANSTTIRNIENENAVLKTENTALQDDLTKINNDSTENIDIYESVIDDMTKVNLICDTHINPETSNPEVLLNVFVNEDDMNHASLQDSLVIVHEIGLTSKQRELLRSNQIQEVVTTLSKLLEDDSSPLIWFTLQYNYDDENFADSDLEVMREAIKSIETRFSKPCHIEEMNIGDNR